MVLISQDSKWEWNCSLLPQVKHTYTHKKRNKHTHTHLLGCQFPFAWNLLLGWIVTNWLSLSQERSWRSNIHPAPFRATEIGIHEESQEDQATNDLWEMVSFSTKLSVGPTTGRRNKGSFSCSQTDDLVCVPCNFSPWTAAPATSLSQAYHFSCKEI